MDAILCYEAGWFSCTVCGADNFLKLIPHVMDREELTTYLDEVGRLDNTEELPQFSRGVLMKYPNYVSCKVCKRGYRPIPMPTEYFQEFEEE